MNFKMRLTTLVLIFATINAEMEDQGPQTFDTSTAAPSPSPAPLPPQPELQKEQPQYEMREVVVYLTPSQINALESGRGYLQPVPQQIPSDNLPNIELQPNTLENEELQKQQEFQKALENQQNAEEAAKVIQMQQEVTPDPPPVKEIPEEETSQEIPAPYKPYEEEVSQPNLDYFVPRRPEPVSKSHTYFNLFNRHNPSNVNIKIFHPLPQDFKLSEDLEAKILETQTDPLLKKKFKLIPYEYLPRKSQELVQFQQQPQVQLLRPFEVYGPEHHLKNLLSAQYEKEYLNNQQKEAKENEERLQEDLIKSKYAPRYNDQKHAIEVQNLLKKQKALAKAEAIAKQPPVEVHREVSITKQKPVHIIKHVQVPVPHPYLVRVPEPFEVKVPQPYPVPLEIIRHVPIEIVKTEKIEVEKPVPYEVEKRIPVPVTKKVYVKVDKPYYVHRTVPVEVKKLIPIQIPIRKPERLTILRHIWEH